jgi:hypothetical protein
MECQNFGINDDKLMLMIKEMIMYSWHGDNV